MLNNFIINAIKYTGDEKILKIKCVEQDSQILVSVLDNGMGIPVEKQKKIFQQFYRVESSTGLRPSGLGLGLFICAEIIRKHNGGIGVNSKEGQGSEFWFSLPLNKV